ncbi:MAG TPA: flagellar biosynthesis anti-sigma factor FlgM [Candidatus Baltobacteraceae bacterium]|nr:flagellar biosynthesis anti-sigma factor FlgM [Candidatus Baltobacteraceae bacterium]
MNISRTESRSAVSAYKAVKRKSTVDPLGLGASDSLEASDAATSLSSLIQDVISEPFYRPDLVEDLRRRISEGRYYVPTEEIVDKMLSRLLVEHATAAA